MTREEQHEFAYETLLKFRGYTAEELEQDFEALRRVDGTLVAAQSVLDELQIARRAMFNPVDGRWHAIPKRWRDLADRIRDQCVGIRVDHIREDCVVCTSRRPNEPGVYDVHQFRTWDDCLNFVPLRSLDDRKDGLKQKGLFDA